jgi:hypothetical protein
VRSHLALAAFVTLGAACHRNNAAQESAASGSVIHGVVSVTGTSFEQQIVLQSPNRNTRLAPASAADSAALVRLGGVEIAARGTIDGSVLRVASFTALSANGSPVVDGIVRVAGRIVSLETATGRVTLGNPPNALLQMNGARVWVSGPIDKGPNSYGVIIPR